MVPKPNLLKIKPGFFALNPSTVISVTPGALPQGELLAQRLRTATGFAFEVVQEERLVNSISLLVEPSFEVEQYGISVDQHQVRLAGGSEAGLWNASQSLLQLLPTEIFAPKVLEFDYTIPFCEILDKPQFSWRGTHLDCARNFMPLDFLYRFVDLISMHKMNVLHLHLTDDQGWRVEIKKYPKLTEIGAWRNETLIGDFNIWPHKFDGVRHGGFYSQEELKRLVVYAQQRNVTIVPEIGFPGHARAILASYPEFGFNENPLPVATRWGDVDQNGNWKAVESILSPFEPTMQFLRDVFTEIFEIFPGTFIHIGGDECPKREWQESPEVQAQMEELGLENESQMQSWMTTEMARFFAQHGRRLIGWDEILEGGIVEGGLGPGASVMSWRGREGGIEAAMLGHDAVMTPTEWTYFDYYQGDKETEPLAMNGFLPLEKVYAFEPIPEELPEHKHKHVLGAQGQLWSEYLPNANQVEYMAFPRLCALAEVLWSEKKEYPDFLERLMKHEERLEWLGVNFRRSE